MQKHKNLTNKNFMQMHKNLLVNQKPKKKKKISEIKII
jgi:hypothetical protein